MGYQIDFKPTCSVCRFAVSTRKEASCDDCRGNLRRHIANALNNEKVRRPAHDSGIGSSEDVNDDLFNWTSHEIKLHEIRVIESLSRPITPQVEVATINEMNINHTSYNEEPSTDSFNNQQIMEIQHYAAENRDMFEPYEMQP